MKLRRPATVRHHVSVLAALLIAVQALLSAWHGAALASLQLDTANAPGTVVICTAHGFARVVLDDNGEPAAPSPDQKRTSQTCALCHGIAEAAIAPAAPAARATSATATIVFPARADRHQPTIFRDAPRQRGPPLQA